jgi:hypothetical protein
LVIRKVVKINDMILHLQQPVIDVKEQARHQGSYAHLVNTSPIGESDSRQSMFLTMPPTFVQVEKLMHAGRAKPSFVRSVYREVRHYTELDRPVYRDVRQYTQLDTLCFPGVVVPTEREHTLAQEVGATSIVELKTRYGIPVIRAPEHRNTGGSTTLPELRQIESAVNVLGPERKRRRRRRSGCMVS